MDFFSRQETAKRNTKRLVMLFAIAVVLIVATVYLAVAAVLLSQGHQRRLWNPELFGGVVLGTLAVIGFGSLFQIMQLREGGGAVARLLGGRPLDPHTREPRERQLLNIIEEMSIASGVPVPAVYVLDEEEGINAFAAGHTTSDYAIGITRGGLQLLSRDELQGVIAHEYSHILNGDMRLNIRLMGLVFGILCLAIVGRTLLRIRSRGKNNPLPLLGLLLLIIGSIGVLFGKLINAAVSRQREFLADAAAVQFTRYPEGLAGALKKIGGWASGARIGSARAEEASHMYFANGLAESWSNLFATHPPLAERIRAIDARFDGEFPTLQPARLQSPPPVPTARREQRLPVPPPGTPAGFFAPTRAIQVADVVERVGDLTTAGLAYAAQLAENLPAEVRAALREPYGASVAVYALVFSGDAQALEKQACVLASATSEATCRDAQLLFAALHPLGDPARLPVMEMALPALRQLSPRQYATFVNALDALIASDNQVDLFEFVLQKALRRHLSPHFGAGGPAVAQYYSLKPLHTDCALVLSALAHLGADDEAAAQSAFQAGWRQLPATAPAASLQNLKAGNVAALGQSLDRLAQAVPHIKRLVLNACAHTVSADGVVQPGEAELLRAVADTLDCPLPPLL